MNQCIHNIDMLLWMFSCAGNEAREVFAYTDRLAHDYIETEDIGIAVIKFTNAAYGTLEGSTNIYPSNYEETLCLFGTEGSVKIGGKSLNKIEHWQVKGSAETPETLHVKFTEEPPNVYGFGHVPLYLDFIEAIAHDKTPYVSAREGKKSLELVLAMHKSAMENRPVKLPLSDVATVDFAGMFK